MTKFLLKTGKSIFLMAVCYLSAGQIFVLKAQTIPAATAIPYSLPAFSGSQLPAEIAVHRFGTTSGAIPASAITTPGTADLLYVTSSASGGWTNEGDNGIGILASGTQSAGAVVLAVNTSGKSNVKVDWMARTITQRANDNNLALQYRIGETGDFINIIDPSGQYTYATSGKTEGNSQAFSYTLPSDADNRAVVELRWIYWQSGSSTRDRIALDDVAVSTGVAGPDITAPAISALSPADNASAVPLTSSLSITFSENVLKGTGDITITNTTDNLVQTIPVTSGSVSVSNNVVSVSGINLLNSKSYSVTVSAGSFTDAAANAFAGIADPAAWNFTTIVPPGTPTKISAIQGSGMSAALTGTYTIEGIVTRTFSGTNGLSGFYVQEEDADADADPATSEGIFVYNVAADAVGVVMAAQGDKVNLTGTVVDFVSTTSGVTTSLTEIKTLTNFTNLGPAALPVVTSVKLPVNSVSDLERYEGMLVELSAVEGNLALTEYFELGRYGQVELSVTGAGNQAGTDARLDQFTQFNAPGVPQYAAYLAELAKRRIILDDGSTRQNPDPIIFGRGGSPLSAANTLRGGDELTSVAGILDERLEGYRIQSASGVNFIPANERQLAPPTVNNAGRTATLVAGSANVLNYFTSLDLNVSGTDFRGANTAEEFNRQKAKIIRALIGSNADVLGLMEIQANGPSPVTALADLVSGLNADPAGSGTYAYIDPATTGNSISTDAITVGIIYKTDKVTPVGNAATLVTSAAFDRTGRRPLAQTFRQIANNQQFTLVVNHFKSKGSSAGAEGDADVGDGQGFSNGTRKAQAEDLAAWLATNPTGTSDPDYLVIGDLNAYAKEDPLTILANAGYMNQLPATSYSYVFDGQVGSLDHALASSSLSAQVTGAAKWHINADEPGVLDYNTEFKSAAQVTGLYNADQFRASDHDPVLIGLALTDPLPVNYKYFRGSSSENRIQLAWETAVEVNNEGFEVLKSKNGRNFEKIGFVQGNSSTNKPSVYAFNDMDISGGSLLYYQLKQIDFDGTEHLSSIIAVHTKTLRTKSFIYPNPNTGSFILSATDQDMTSIKLYDILGRQVQISKREIESASISEIRSDLPLSKGMYYLIYRTAADKNEKSLSIIVR